MVENLENIDIDKLPDLSIDRYAGEHKIISPKKIVYTKKNIDYLSDDDLTEENIDIEMEKKRFIGDSNYYFVRNPKLLIYNLIDKIPQEKWVVQKFQRGGYVKENILSSIPPIITKGMTSISVTDNRYTSEVRGLPSPYRYFTIKEYLRGDKAGQRQIRSLTTIDKWVISNLFVTYVHNLFLRLIGKRYSKEMQKYLERLAHNGKKIHPIISKTTLIYELEVIIDTLKKGKQLPLKDRSEFSLEEAKKKYNLTFPEEVKYLSLEKGEKALSEK